MIYRLLLTYQTYPIFHFCTNKPQQGKIVLATSNTLFHKFTILRWFIVPVMSCVTKNTRLSHSAFTTLFCNIGMLLLFQIQHYFLSFLCSGIQK